MLNIRDYPFIYQSRDPSNPPGPLFSFSTTHRHADIMYPTWGFFNGGPWLHELSREDNNRYWRWDVRGAAIDKNGKMNPWETKKPRGFFRGSRTDNERDILIELGKEHEDILDAKFTKGEYDYCH